jgi:hypothetical protein
LTPLLFLLTFAFYLCGLSGTIPSYRDSGDLIASIHVLGIAHPPGYALYVLIGKLFVTLLPFGNVAYRVNVMSAFFAAAAVAVLFRFLGANRRSVLPGLGVAILFATSPAMVALARVAEMYTLAVFLAGAILLCLSSEDSRGMSIAALLLGLGLSVHPTLIFLVPLFVVSYRRTYRYTPAAYFLLGLAIFLYLPIRASQHPPVNWGDPSHWRNFWRVVTRADYGGFKLHPEQSSFSWTAASAAAQVKYFVMTSAHEWGWAGLLLGSLGVFVGTARAALRRGSIGLLVSWILSGPAFFLLSNLPLAEPTTPAILQPYLLLPGVLWAPFVAMGMECVLSWGGRRDLSKSSIMIDRFAALAMAALVLLARPCHFASQRNDFFAYDYARNLLRSLPRNAVLYEPDDPTHFSIRVLQLVENRRPDLVLLSFFRTRWGYEEIRRAWPDLLPPIPIDNGQELLRLLWSYSARKRPFYADLPQKFTPVPYRAGGLVYAAQTESSASSREHAEALLALYVQRGDFVTAHHADYFTSHLISYYAAAQNNLGIEYADAGDWPRAAAHYETALRLEPGQSAARQNLAVALQKIGKLF